MDVTQFQGRFSHSDPHDIPPGAMIEQDNLTCITPGQLTPRKCLSKVDFSNESAQVAGQDGIACYHYQRPEATWLIVQADHGKVLAFKSPS